MQRLMARSNEHHGPEEILERRGSELTERPRQITFLKPDEKPEEMGRGRYQYSPGKVEVQEEEAAEAATGWKDKRDAIWTDGSRLEGVDVGAACVWWQEAGPAPHRWLGRSGRAYTPGYKWGGGREAFLPRKELAGFRYRAVRSLPSNEKLRGQRRRRPVVQYSQT